MREAFLHYIWRTRQFDTSSLISTQGEKIELLHFGHYNTGDGPDFSFGRVKIKNTVWVGPVEMHLKSSDWYKHGHQLDPSYDNVVLHVVWEDDEPVLQTTGNLLPTLVLDGKVDKGIVDNYQALASQEHDIPCQQGLFALPELVIHSWIDRIMLQRLQQKMEQLDSRLSALHGDYEAALFGEIARCLGMPYNTIAMDRVLELIPFKLLKKYAVNQLQITALLLGVAGFLSDELYDPYPRALQYEFTFLQHKHKLVSLPRHTWNFSNLRPASFPTIRLAQLAAVVAHKQNLLNLILENPKQHTFMHLFDGQLHAYWDTHYIFDRESKAKPKRVGKAALHSIVINAIVPYLFLYGRRQGKPYLETAAIQLLKTLPPERNKILKQWHNAGLSAENAGESQALIQLHKTYCRPRKCLECAIGNALIKSTETRKLEDRKTTYKPLKSA